VTLPSTLTAALAWHDAGATVVPTRVDGTKAPAANWKRYTTQRPTRDQVEAWYAGGHPGLGLVCGAVSGGLEMLEFEGRAVDADLLKQCAELLHEAGLSDLWSRLIGGYTEATPSEGLHILYRISGGPVPGNTKLARNPAGEVLVETRGEGGYVVVAPSHGPVHPSGNKWEVVHGTPTTVPTLTLDERNELHQVIRLLDQAPPPADQPTTPAPVARTDGALSPGDDYEQRTTWADILAPHGWTVVRRVAGRTFWRRPGKTLGSSATSGGAADGRDRLYVFTSSTLFEQEKPYTKFGAYALLEHGGDHSAAARELRRAGYGSTEPDRGVTDLIAPSRVLAAVDGTAVRPIPDADDPDAEAVDDDLPVTWAPVDLDAVLTGTHTPPTPTLFPRADGTALIYPGLIHSFHGESESGKSLIVQAEAARLLGEDQDVLYLDFESDAQSVIGRLLALGVDPAAIRNHFHYVRPDTDFRRIAHEHQAWQQLLERRYALAVIDGVTDALGLAGAPSADNDEVSAWYRRVPRTIARRTGAAVALIDHVTKDPETRGRFAIGGQAKMAALDGAAYVVDVTEALGRGLRGVVTIRVAKDRPGGVRPHCGTFRKSDRTQEAARIVVDSRDGDKIRVSVEPPSTIPVAERPESELSGVFRPTGLMEKVSRFLEINGPQSLRGIRETLNGSNSFKDMAAEQLVKEGFADEQSGPRNARMFTSIRPYREADDPHSDRFQGGDMTTVPDRAGPCRNDQGGTVRATVPAAPSPYGGAGTVGAVPRTEPNHDRAANIRARSEHPGGGL
jgi:hypothetical protein